MENRTRKGDGRSGWGGCNEPPERDSLRSYPCRKHLKEVREQAVRLQGKGSKADGTAGVKALEQECAQKVQEQQGSQGGRSGENERGGSWGGSCVWGREPSVTMSCGG